eukprot:TRINITY_DN1655_c0_g1_i2.p1 TRINITY_DN1655_c0_g1~~TRINITY_DN1655_c0_g1_i2.p1  ORF type:complete len:430 (+),score=62.15 TRINITY_DN1655_c0_g1_i2:105-1292(+)
MKRAVSWDDPSTGENHMLTGAAAPLGALLGFSSDGAVRCPVSSMRAEPHGEAGGAPVLILGTPLKRRRCISLPLESSECDAVRAQLMELAGTVGVSCAIPPAAELGTKSSAPSTECQEQPSPPALAAPPPSPLCPPAAAAAPAQPVRDWLTAETLLLQEQGCAPVPTMRYDTSVREPETLLLQEQGCAPVPTMRYDTSVREPVCAADAEADVPPVPTMRYAQAEEAEDVVVEVSPARADCTQTPQRVGMPDCAQTPQRVGGHTAASSRASVGSCSTADGGDLLAQLIDAAGGNEAVLLSWAKTLVAEASKLRVRKTELQPAHAHVEAQLLTGKWHRCYKLRRTEWEEYMVKVLGMSPEDLVVYKNKTALVAAAAEHAGVSMAPTPAWVTPPAVER